VNACAISTCEGDATEVVTVTVGDGPQRQEHRIDVCGFHLRQVTRATAGHLSMGDEGPVLLGKSLTEPCCDLHCSVCADDVPCCESCPSEARGGA
jgi:hypothetical protein